MPPRLQQLGRFGLRGLRIAASTIALIELLRSDWRGGLAASLAWLAFIQVERRLNQLQPDNAEGEAD
jgi:hypothetical protein